MRHYPNLHLLRSTPSNRRRAAPALFEDHAWESKLDGLAEEHRGKLFNSAPQPPIHEDSDGPSPNPPLKPYSGERVRGWTSVPLLPEGVKQAEDTGAQIKRKGTASGIHTPTLRRSIQTAQAVSSKSGVPIVEANPDYSTRGWGSMDGKPLAKVLPEMIRLQRDAPDEQPPGGGESTNQYFQRFLPAIDRLLKETEHQGGKAILINHHSGIKALEAWIKAGALPDYSVDLNEFIRHDGEPGDAYSLYRDPKGQLVIKPTDLTGKEPLKTLTIIRHGQTEMNGAKGADEGSKLKGPDHEVDSRKGLSTEEQQKVLEDLRTVMRSPGFTRMPSQHRVKIQSARLALEAKLPKASTKPASGAIAS